MLERPNAHLRVLIDERDSLSLVEQSELVHAVHVGHVNDLLVTGPPGVPWSSLRCRAPPRR